MQARFRVLRRAGGVVLLAVVATTAFHASATGLAIPAQSASGAGVAVAGAAAGVDDAATVFYNPAGMLRLDGRQVTAALGIAWTDLDAGPVQGSDVLGNPLAGNAAAHPTANAIPSLYAILIERPGLRLGLGLSTPYGQRLEYDRQWVGRYEVVDAALRDHVVGLAGAISLDPTWSAGFGIDYHRASVVLESSVDFGAVCLGALGGPVCAGLGLLPQQADGNSRLELSGGGFGYVVGLIYDPRSAWRTGVTFRSAVRLRLAGDQRFDLPAAALPLNAGGAFDATSAESRLTLPENLHWGIAWRAGGDTEWLAGVTWTRWSRFDRQRVDYASPAQASMDQTLAWRDAFRYAFGVRHALSPRWTLSAGLAYQETPVAPAHATPRYPIGDAREVDLGVGWRIAAGTRLDFSYGYRTESAIAYTVVPATVGPVTGSVRMRAQSIGAQVNHVY